MARTPARKLSAKPLSNTGNYLEAFLPLLPAEEKLRQCASSGGHCVAVGFDNQRPSLPSRNNTVRAEFLRYMIRGGCEQAPVSERGFRVSGLYVKPPKNADTLDLTACSIETELMFLHCRFDLAVVMKSVTCASLCLEGSSVVSLNLERAKINGNLLLNNGFETSEAVRMNGVHISGGFSAEKGSFLDPNNSIIANRARIDGDVDLGNVTAMGTIAFTGSEIGGDFTPQGAVLDGTPALQLRNSKIGGTLHWRGLGFVDGEVDLSSAACKTLNTGQTSWLRKRDQYRERRDELEQTSEPERKPLEYHTKLDNFTYDGFSNLPDNCKSDYWIEWLKQQPDEHLGKKFKPRPWEQLAKVLDTMGYEEEADRKSVV